jgi:CubicO group peptidase (beta-lactamase class C family)
LTVLIFAVGEDWESAGIPGTGSPACPVAGGIAGDGRPRRSPISRHARTIINESIPGIRPDGGMEGAMTRTRLSRSALVAFAGIVGAASPPAWGQVTSTFSPDQVASFHQRFAPPEMYSGGAVSHYVWLNASEFFPSAAILRGPRHLELSVGSRPEIGGHEVRSRNGPMPLDEYVRKAPVDGVIVVHRGNVVYETYPRMQPSDRHLTWSVSKVFASTLIDILERRGLIDVSKPVDAYLPELAESGWRGVPIRDVLDMSSGIGCREFVPGALNDPATCYYQFHASLGWSRRTSGSPASPYEHLAGMKRARPPGEALEYTSVDTFVLGWLAQEVTGTPYPELLEREIWRPMGAENDADILLGPSGAPAVHAGISLTLRDLARFGLLFTPSGRRAPGGSDVVTDATIQRIRNSGRPDSFIGDIGQLMLDNLGGERPASFTSRQWDFVTEEGDFSKAGWGGQGLYVSPRRDLVIAYYGTPREDDVWNEMIWISRQLATSGLFAD